MTLGNGNGHKPEEMSPHEFFETMKMRTAELNEANRRAADICDMIAKHVKRYMRISFVNIFVFGLNSALLLANLVFWWFIRK